jgi:hypothetical protein
VAYRCSPRLFGRWCFFPVDNWGEVDWLCVVGCVRIFLVFVDLLGKPQRRLTRCVSRGGSQSTGRGAKRAGSGRWLGALTVSRCEGGSEGRMDFVSSGANNRPTVLSRPFCCSALLCKSPLHSSSDLAPGPFSVNLPGEVGLVG